MVYTFWRRSSVHLSEPKASLEPAAAAERSTYLTRAITDRFGATQGCKACAGKGGHQTPECRDRLGKLLKEERLAQEAVAAAATAAAAGAGGPQAAVQTPEAADKLQCRPRLSRSRRPEQLPHPLPQARPRTWRWVAAKSFAIAWQLMPPRSPRSV